MSTVYLIGAGPGAPDLISLRGYRCLQLADVVIFDHLVHPDLLAAAPEHAERIDVGSAAPEQRDQDAICFLLAEKAREGKTVARLFHDNSPHATTPDYAAYERDMVAFVDNVRRQGLGNLQVTWEIGRIFDILRRHRIQARSHMTIVNLALMTAEGLGKRLDPDLSLADEALPYLAEAIGVPPA